MLFTASIATALAFAAMTAAQTTIMVGAAQNAAGGAFQFMPPNITATNGTVVTFMFTGSPGNHTVAQSTLDSPCQPMSGGFDSGFIFVPANTTSGFPSWNLTITNDQDPIYFYCAQLQPVPHCSSGMVGTINAPAGSFDAFQQAAMNTAPNQPGNPSPNLVGVGASASAAPGPFSGNITGFGVPTAAANASAASAASTSGASSAASSGASSGTAPASSSGAPAATNSTSAASLSAANTLMVFLASLLGITLL